jgi:hypothetical protein
MNRVAAVLAVLSAFVGAPAYAQAPPPQPYNSTINRHLGFALRLDGGIGYTGTSATVFGSDVSIKGGSGAFGLVIGGAVAENFILGADLWDTVAFSPTVNGASTSGNTSLTLAGFGVNLTYYFMPANVYVSLSPSVTTLSLTSGGVSGSTDTGFGMKLGVGKEWWVSDHWGLGVAGQFFFSSNNDNGSGSPKWSTTAFAVAFSATYN